RESSRVFRPPTTDHRPPITGRTDHPPPFFAMNENERGPLDSRHPADSNPMQPGLSAYPPEDRWDDWVELESRTWPRRDERHYALIPTTCFNCESACG